ncbi:hypothetical protein PR202_ga26683 [Eleusine coracana subsp. coracana]|uniref:CUE domain-containing protein n=1 Tax=Eleusine coracana subsp. coracana TaxID=191504 RepID=A0AAV5DER4_ELECO|nr:hypothetical protein PR202_ga26683 [Eleusine coracana subsp. coracana]
MSSAPPAHQSKPSNHHRRNPHNYHGQRQQQQPPPQQRYVPKSPAAHAAPEPSPQPSLTAALRSTTTSSSASGAGRSTSVGGGGGVTTDAFVAYLPHDEAVAAGLGGLDAQESQAVVDLLNDALAALLRAPPREFWHQDLQIRILEQAGVTNAINVQPNVLDGVNITIPQFLKIFHTMHERCMTSLQVLTSPGSNDHGHVQLQKDFLEVLDFVNDGIVTLDAFVGAYQPAALLFCANFEMSHGVEELLNALSRLHDSLLPSLLQGFKVMSKSQSNGETSENKILSNVALGIKMLSKRTVRFGWRLLHYCYLNDQLRETDAQASTKMFPAKVEDPMIRGDILVQTLKDINREASLSSQVNHGNTFLRVLEQEFQLMSRIGSIRNKGWIYMDDEQFQFLSRLCGFDHTSWNIPGLPIPSHDGQLQKKVEEAAIIESKISQIRDLFPDYGKGFLAACLEAYNLNPEEVIQRILEGTLHQDLLALDTSLEEMPQKKHTPIAGKDKGKGILVETPQMKSKPPKIAEIHHSAEDGPSSSVSSATQGPSSSVSSVPQGRFTRKGNDDLPETVTLDSKNAKDAIRSAVLESQYEYEDEYDDSFDDLGFSVVESSYEETDGANDAEASSHGPRWSSQKKPQFYVKDGKNYSYKVAGSVAVSSAREAAVIRQTEKDTIYGLGRGGNIPFGVPNRQHIVMEEERGNGVNNFVGGASNPRGRGRRDGRGLGNPPPENENSSGRGFGRGRRGGWNQDKSAEEDGTPNVRQQGFGRGARRGDRNQDHRSQDHSGEDNEDHDSPQAFPRGGPGPRGGGGRRGGRNHNRRDRAMKKHMQGMTGL